MYNPAHVPPECSLVSLINLRSKPQMPGGWACRYPRVTVFCRQYVSSPRVLGDNADAG